MLHIRRRSWSAFQYSLRLQTTERREVSSEFARESANWRMDAAASQRATDRRAAARRSSSPFLREAAQARPDIVEPSSRTASERGSSRWRLRGRRRPSMSSCAAQRLGLALAVALGDLCGRASARTGDAALSDFADHAIDGALSPLRSASACPTPSLRGFAVIAMGKLGSRELNYSSDVDLLLLFDPATLPRRERDDAGEAAVRDRPADDRDSAEADRRRLCRAGRPAACARRRRSRRSCCR